MGFLKNLLASLLGNLIALFIFMFVGVAIIVALVGALASEADKSNGVEIKSNTILKISLGGEIVELAEENPFEGMDLPMNLGSSKKGVLNLVEKIDFAATDSKISAIYLDLFDISASYAAIEDIREALERFKSSGKPIYAYAEVLSEKAYFLASVSDKIFLNEQGMLEFKGLGAELMFFKGALDKLGVETKIFRVGKYKSAIEPFIQEKMSDANREQTRAFIESIYKYNIEVIAKSRKIEPSRLRQISDELLVQEPSDAVSLGLIDGVIYVDQFLDSLKSYLHVEDKLNFVSPSKYVVNKNNAGDKIAVLIAEGDIISGSKAEGYVASDYIVDQLRKIREDKDVKGLLLRINSPGGSALASDVMWRELELTRKQMPVVTSMSGVAASGGYYMAAATDKIVAHSNTVTGSIGVFGLLINTESLMKDKLGITFDRVNTGQHSDIMSITKPITTADSAIIQKGVNKIYQTFLERVAVGRHKSVNEIQEIAQGRVWSGQDALSNGLVDEIGGFTKAIEVLKDLAKVDKYYIQYYPAPKNFFEKLSENSEESVYSQSASALQLRKYIKEYQYWINANGVQMRLPFTSNDL